MAISWALWVGSFDTTGLSLEAQSPDLKLQLLILTTMLCHALTYQNLLFSRVPRNMILVSPIRENITCPKALPSS